MSAKHLTVAMMGLGLSAAGCSVELSAADLAAMDPEAIGYKTLENPSGGGTTNHLTADWFHAHKYELLSALGQRLTTANATQSTVRHLSAGIDATNILSSTEGREVFTLAIECALPDGEYVIKPSGSLVVPNKYYYGKGLMSTTAVWQWGSLTLAQKEDVLRCVVARLNQFGVEVPLVLTGQNVTNKPGEAHGSVWQPDALFDVRVAYMQPNFTPRISTFAWALGPNADWNGAEPCHPLPAPFTQRLCDDNPENCGVTIRTNWQADCTHHAGSEDNPAGYYTCFNGVSSGRPVVQTWVDTSVTGGGDMGDDGSNCTD